MNGLELVTHVGRLWSRSARCRARALVVLLGAAGVVCASVSDAYADSPLCASSAESQFYEWVTRVKIGTGTSHTGPTPYYDGSGAVLASLQAGQTYPVEVDVATDGSTYQEFVKIWLDLNQNGEIEDPAELVFDQNAEVTGLRTFPGTITVPPTAFNGQIHARMIMQFSGSPNLCGSYAFGETEDYLLAVTGGVQNPDNQTLSITTSGDGSVTSAPLGLDCPGTCSFDFEEGAVVSLAATPNAGSIFAGWSGDCSGLDPSVEVTMAAAQSCSATFIIAAVDECGDGIKSADEKCDDAGESESCDANCTFASCGDGTINATAGEPCDDAGESVTCDANCTFVSCGDGTTNASAGEQCDDAGTSTDCNVDCTITDCGDGIVNVAAGEECDDAGESATCNAKCSVASCGDGFVNVTAGESCDDSGESADCNADCSPATCGDGVVNGVAGEVCDDAGASDTCNIDCTSALGGDGVLNESAGEECDDSDNDAGDGCSADCLIEQPQTGGSGSGGAGPGSGGAGPGSGGAGPGSGGAGPGSGGAGPGSGGSGGSGPGSGGSGPGSGGSGPGSGAGGPGSGGEGPAGTTGGPTTSVDAATGAGSGGDDGSTTPVSGAGGAGGGSRDGYAPDDSGCGCAVPGKSPSLPQGGVAAMGLAIAAVFRRRMRRRGAR